METSLNEFPALLQNNIQLRKLCEMVASLKELQTLKRSLQHYDEPKYWSYSTYSKFKFDKNKHHSSGGHGVSFFSQEEALIKCFAETIERYCSYYYSSDFSKIKCSYEDLKERGRNALDPLKLQKFTQNDLKKISFKDFRINSDSIFNWTIYKELESGKRILIPAQTTYLSYFSHKENLKEKIIFPVITTGAASGWDTKRSILNGMYEIIERDSFMIFYLNRLPAPKINLRKIDDPRIKKMLNIFQRYNLEIVCLDLTTDLKIFSTAAVLIDKTGIGKAVSVGLKSNVNPIKAIIGAIEEALHTRTWYRKIKNRTNYTVDYLLKHPTHESRGRLWTPVESINKLDFWLKGNSYTKLKMTTNSTTLAKEFNIVKKHILDKGYQIYYKDITLPQFRKYDFYTTMVIIPDLQPFYLDDNRKYLEGKRLKEVPFKLGYNIDPNHKLNTFPHPFI